MIFKKFTWLVFAIFIAGTASAQSDQLKFGDFLPASTITNSVIIPEFIEKVAMLSGNQLVIKHYPGGILGSGGKAQLSLVEKGVLDIAEVVTTYTPGRIKGLEVLELPYLFTNERDGAMMAQYLGNQGLLEGTESLKILGFQEVGPYIIHSAKKIEKLNDIKGLKFRVVGAAQAEIIRRLGGVPVGNITATQIAENLHRGVIDGVLMDMGNVYNFNMNDITKYHVTNLYLGGNAIIFPMTVKKYNQLSPQSQHALNEVSQGWFTTLLGAETQKQSQQAYAQMQADGGHYFIEFSQTDLDEIQVILDDYRDEWLAQDPKNQQLYDAIKNYRKSE